MVKPEVEDKGGSSTDEEVKCKRESEKSMDLELKQKRQKEIQCELGEGPKKLAKVGYFVPTRGGRGALTESQLFVLKCSKT